MRIEYMDLDEIRKAPVNPKAHDQPAIAASMAEFGFVAPPILDEGTGQLVAGHGRLETLEAMRLRGDAPPDRVQLAAGGGWRVPVVRGVSFADPLKASAYLLADNRVQERGGWDTAELEAMLRGMPVQALASTGFTLAEVDEMLAASQAEQELAIPAQPTEIEVGEEPDEAEGEPEPEGIEDFGKGRLRAPFPYFGGKYAVAPYVWQRLGNPKQYLEPFCGSAAVLLANPVPATLEVVGDASCYIANFWRALRFAPDELWKWADYPVSHIDQVARHRWLTETERVTALRAALTADPDWPGDPKVAGWWVWGQCSWIGSGWCEALGVSDKKPRVHAGVGLHVQPNPQGPFLSRPGQGLQGATVSDQKPHHGNVGRGVQRPGVDPHAWLRTLSARLTRVRVIHGTWDRCLNHHYGGDDTAVFLDPPYAGYESPYGGGL